MKEYQGIKITYEKMESGNYCSFFEGCRAWIVTSKKLKDCKALTVARLGTMSREDMPKKIAAKVSERYDNTYDNCIVDGHFTDKEVIQCNN